MSHQLRSLSGRIKLMFFISGLLVCLQVFIFLFVNSESSAIDYSSQFQEDKESQATQDRRNITVNRRIFSTKTNGTSTQRFRGQKEIKENRIPRVISTVNRGINSILTAQRVLLNPPRTEGFTNQKKIIAKTQRPRFTTILQFTRSSNSSKTMPKDKPTTKKPVDMENDYYPFVDFSFVWPKTTPDLKGKREFFLVVLVNSAARGEKYRQRREAVRKTWAKHMTKCERLQSLQNPRLKKHKWILVFSLGKAGNTADEKANAEEAKIHNDVLIGNFEDIYLNNIIKMFMGKLWVSSLNVRYVLKTDDDVYVRIPSVMDYLVAKDYPKPFYAGAPYFNFKVDRDPNGKWAVSKKYFNEESFPPFCAGAFYVLSTDILFKLFNYVRQRRPFHTDDAYLGIAARDMNITVQRIPGLLLEPSMSIILRGMNDSALIQARGYGHDIDPPMMNTVFNRLEDLCARNNTTFSKV